MKKVIVLGAGIAGLAAAYELAQKGIPVEIVESAPEIGGLAKNSYFKGFTFDMGPHRIYSESPETMQFIKELCGNELLTVTRKSRMRIKDRYYEYPPSAKELLFNLPPSLWIKFISSYLTTRITPSGKLPDESNYEGYLIRRYGKALCDFFFLPYAKKVWGIPPNEISAEIARLRLSQKNLTSTIKDILKGPSSNQPKTAVNEFYYPKKGVGVIAANLAERVKKLGVTIRCNSRVNDFILEKTSFGSRIKEVLCESKEGLQHIECDKVISTIPLSNLVPATHPENQELSMVSKSLRHRSIILICLLVRKPHISDDHWLYFPEEDFNITRIHQPKNFSPFLCPPNMSSLVGEITCKPDDSRWNSTDLELFDYTLGDFLSSDLVYETDIDTFHIVRIRHAYPIYDTNYQNKLNQLFQYLKTIENLITTGRQGLFHHNNIDHSIIMGQSAVTCILKSTEPSREWYDQLHQFDRFRIVD